MTWENLIENKIREVAKPEYSYCDVGACWGEFTLLFKSLAGQEGKVYTFEINPANIEKMSHLSSDNCIIEHMAVSDKNSIIDVYGHDDYSYENWNTNILGYDVARRPFNKICEVQSTTLDNYFTDKRLDVIKIDVEGADLMVMRGGIETFKKCKLVIIECHFQEDWGLTCDFCKDHGLEFKDLKTNLPLNPDFHSYQIYLEN